MRALAICALLGLAACQPDDQALPLEISKLPPAEAAACADDGGEVTLNGWAEEICQRPTMDAGRACNAESPCDGMCLVNADGGGQCAPHTPYFGCNEVFTSRGETATICVD